MIVEHHHDAIGRRASQAQSAPHRPVCVWVIVMTTIPSDGTIAVDELQVMSLPKPR